MVDALSEVGVWSGPSSGHATPTEQVHLTLQFIGDTAERELDDVRESVARSCAGIDPFILTPRRLVSCPLNRSRGRARLIALETDLPSAMTELHRRLASRLARPKRGRADVEKDRFVPHITL